MRTAKHAEAWQLRQKLVTSSHGAAVRGAAGGLVGELFDEVGLDAAWATSAARQENARFERPPKDFSRRFRSASSAA
jgi:hypothetical protein